ncbi:MAG: hypothetical protein WKF73_12650 [Nocardioidaceae bacterium]
MTHSSTQLLAHGVGGRSDLPIPAGYACAAAAAALVVSFAVLTLAWRSSKFSGNAADGRWPEAAAAVVDSRVDSGATRGAGHDLRRLGEHGSAFRCCKLGQPDLGSVYALAVGGTGSSGAAARVRSTGSCNPLRWLHRGVCAWWRAIAPASRRCALSRPARVCGRLPSLLLAFVWLELVDPATATDLTWVTLWFAVVGRRVAARCGGVRRHLVRCTPTRSSVLHSGGAPVAVRAHERRHLGGAQPARQPRRDCSLGLDLSASVSVLLGSTAFDSFQESSRWLRFSQQYPDDATLAEQRSHSRRLRAG